MAHLYRLSGAGGYRIFQGGGVENSDTKSGVGGGGGCCPLQEVPYMKGGVATLKPPPPLPVSAPVLCCTYAAIFSHVAIYRHAGWWINTAS